MQVFAFLHKVHVVWVVAPVVIEMLCLLVLHLDLAVVDHLLVEVRGEGAFVWDVASGLLLVVGMKFDNVF